MRERRPLVIIGGFVLVVALVLAAIAGQDDDGGVLDPDGTGPAGLRALVRLVETADGEVDESIGPRDDTTVVAVFRDRLTGDQRAEVRDWVADGGTLVVADASSPLAPEPASRILEFDLTPGRGTCDVGALDALTTISADTVGRYEVAAGNRSCFGDGDAAWLVATDWGDGTVVAIADPGPFINARIAEADNAALVLALLAPVDGGSVVIARGAVGSGDRGLLDLVADPVWLAVIQLGVAFVLFAWARGRRLGAVVDETRPVVADGAALVRSTGRLLGRTVAVDALAAELRERTIADIGVDPRLAPALARQHGFDRDDVDELFSRPVADDDGLVALAADLDRLRDAMLAVPVAATDGAEFAPSRNPSAEPPDHDKDPRS
ncbi:MAG: DUF4350 domain-containing protein [Acidimicrobiales bacterium]